MQSRNITLQHVVWLLAGLTLLFVIVWLAPAIHVVQGLSGYLPLHMVAETFSIILSMMVFGVAWNAYSAERPGNIVILSCALLAVGLIDFAHMLSFKGMPDFITPSDPEKAINLWLSARLVAALGLLAVAIRSWELPCGPRARFGLLALSLVVSGTVIWLGLAYPQAWPRTFIAGQGLTPFKIGAEFTIVAILLISAVRFFLTARRTQSCEASSLFAATAITILSELIFSLYSDVADVFNLLGHLYKILAYFFIYRAVFIVIVHEPFQRLDAELAENRHIAKELRTASIYMRSLIEANLDPLMTINAEGKITDVNRATEVATGRKRSELIGIDFSDCFVEPAKAKKAYQEAFMKGYVSDYPLVLSHRDGYVTNMLYNASVYKNEQGEVLGVFASARDITEHRREELARSQLAAIVEFSSDAIIGKTPNGIITSWNRGAEQLYGYRAREAIGQSIEMLAAPALHAEIRELLDAVSKGSTVRNHETKRLRKDGTVIDVALTLSPIRNLAGKISGISTIARDITERKHMELERFETLRYFESMDKINRAMQGSKDLERMLSDVLDEVLDIFGCDRVGLVYPCDPQSPTWQIMMERAKPGYSTEPRRGPLPMTEIRAESLQMLLDANGPVQFTPEDDPDLARLETFGIRSFLSMVVRPRVGGAWEFGIHQCTHARTWSTREEKLFEGIGRRLADGLSTMLVYRDLQESETKYRNLIQNIQAGVVVHDANTQILISNSLAQEILGLSAEQLVGKTAIDPAWHFFREDGKVAAPDEYPVNRVLASRQPLRNCILGVHRPDLGGDVWTLVNADPVFGSEGAIAQIIVTFIDITERKRMEAALQESEEQFRRMFEKHHAVMLLIDPETGMILDANKAAAEYYGYPREKLMSMAIQEINMMLPEQVALEREKAAQEKRNFFVFPHRLASGVIRTVEVHSSPITVHGKQILFSITHDITERKQAEEDLRREQELMNRIMVTSPVGIAVVNKYGQITFANPQAENILGLSTEEITRRAYNAPDWHTTAIDGGPFADEEQPFSRVMATREPVFDVQHAIVWPDGRSVLLSINGAPIFDVQGEIEAVAFAIEDITERKQSEKALFQAQQMFRTLVENSPDIITRYDRECRRTYVNPTYLKVAKVQSQGLMGTTPMQRSPLPADSAAVLQKLLRKVLDNGTVEAVDVVWPMADKIEHWFNVYAFPEFDPEGKVVSVMTVSRDITERKQAEAALRRSEQSLIESQRMAHLGNWHMDLATHEVHWSEELYKMYGFDPELPPPLYTESSKLFTPESWEKLSAAIARAAETGISYELELELAPKEGDTRWMLTRGELIRDEGGAPAMVRGVVMDITERKRAEEEIRKFNQELEQRVTERTAQLEAANKELESFSYSVSHDLRTPLRAIDGFSHILLEDYANMLDDNGKRLLNVVRDNTIRMGQLIEDILKFSRASRSEISFATIDMEQLVYSVFAELQPSAEGSKMQVEIEQLPPARGDRAMMRQVFVNLISNAIKFSHFQEIPKIKVGSTVKEDETIYYVKDNGVGFDMQYADKLFGVFQRLHSVNEFEGTGIGLAIVKRIIGKHGGRVWAEGKVNDGATIYFSLPRNC